MKAYKHILLTGVCMLWFCFRVMPQLCPSNALAPVFKQDFGQGSSATSTTAAVAGSTNYVFGSVGTDGDYVITPSFDVSGKADWTKLGDHTGNQYGNMFLVNAGGNKSIFFKQRVSGLCSGSTFNFSAYLANANTSATQAVCGSGLVYPKVIFNIKDTTGTVLATYTTGNLPLSPVNGPANWQQYGFQFSLPNGTTDLVLEMVDYYGGAAACGNDLALDDILFTACTPQVTVSLNTAAAICSGTNTSISSSLTNSPFVNPAYQWQKSTDNGVTWVNTGTADTGSANLALNNVSVADGALYRILVGPNVASLTSSSCVSASSSISLTVYPSPSVSVSASTHVCSGFPLSLFLTASGGTTPYTYTWTGPNSFSSTLANPTLPAVAITASGVYTLALTDVNNCTANNQVTLPVLQSPVLTVTNNSPLICTGSSTNIGSASSISGSNFSWTASLLSGTATGFATGITGSNSNIGDLLTNTTTVPAGVLYNIVTTTPDGCSTAGSTTVTIQPAPSAAHAGPAQNLCAVTSATLSANTPAVGVGSWTYPANTTGVAFSSAASAVTTVSGLTTGTYRFVWNISNGVCAVSTDTVNITISSTTVPGTLSADATLCSGANSGTVSLTGYTGNIVQWETSTDNGINWVIVANTANSYTYSNVTAKTNIRALVQSGVCSPQYSNIVTLTVDPITVPGTLSSNATVCAGANSGTISLAGYTGNITQWELSVDNGTTWSATTNTSNTNSYTNLVATTLFRAQVQSGVCSALYSNPVTITVDAATAAGALSGTAVVCAGANSGTISLTGYTGAIQHWELSTDNGTTWTNDANTSASYTYTNIAATTQYRALVQNGVCAAQYANPVSVSVNAVTVAGSLTANATVCAGTNSGTLSLAGYTGNILQWETSIDNGSTWSPTTNTTNTFSYTNLVTTTLFRTQIQSGVCSVIYSNIATIAVDAATVPGALSGTAVVCSGANSGTISLTGYTGNIQHWELSTDNGANWTTDASIGTPFSYNNLTATTQYRVLVQSGVCAAQYANPVTVSANAVTVAGSLTANATVCSGANGGSLSLTGYTGNILQWETSIDNGSTWSPTANTTNTISYTNLITTTLFRAQVQSGVCSTVYSNITTITVNAATVSGTLSGTATVCSGANTGNIVLTGFTGNLQQWETSVDNGNTWMIDPQTTAAYSYNNLTSTTQFRVLVQSGVCTQQYANTITVTVNAATVAGTLSAGATVCASANSGTIILSGYTGGILLWETSVDSGSTWSSTSNTSNTFSYSNLNTTTQFRAQVQSGVCGVQYSNVAAITVDAATVAGNMTGTATVCAGTNNGAIVLTGYTGNIQQWEISNDNGVSWSVDTSISASYAYNNLSATTQFRAAVKSGVCPVQYSAATVITVDALSNGGVLSANATVCAGGNGAMLSLTGYTGAIQQWEISDDNGNTWSVIANTADNYTYNNLLVTTQYRALVKTGACSAAYSNPATITVNAATVAGSLSGTNTVCATANSGVIDLTGNTGNIVHWETSVDNGATWNIVADVNQSHPYTNLSVTTQFRALVQSGVCSALYSNIVAVSVDAATVPGTIAGNATVCANANAGSLSLTGNTGGILQWETSVDNGSTWSASTNTTNSFPYSNLTASTLVRAQVQNGVCNAGYTNIGMVTVDAATNSGILTGGATVCAGTNAGNISLSAHTGNILGWETSTDNGSSWTAAAGTTTNYAYTNITATTLVRVKLQSGVCSAAYAAAAALQVDATTVPGSLAGDTVVCAGSNNGSFALTGNAGSIIRWETSIDNGANWSTVSNNTAAYNYSNVNTSTEVRALIQNGVCAAQYSNNGILAVSQPATVAVAGPDQTLCAQLSATLAANSAVSGVGSWSILSNASAVVSDSSSATTSVGGLVPGSYTFAWSIRNQACPASADTITIIVLPAITNQVDTSHQTLCYGQTFSIPSSPATGGNGAYQYQWEQSTNGSQWVLIPGATGANYSTLADSSVFIRRAVSSGACTAPGDAVPVIVHALVNNNTITGDQRVCIGDSAQLLAGSIPTGGNGSYQYLWLTSIDSGATWINIPAATRDIAPGFVPVNTLYKRMVSSGACVGTYSSTSNLVTVTAQAVARAEIITSVAKACAPFRIDSSVINAVVYNNRNSQYNWYVNDTLRGSGTVLPAFVLTADSAVVKLKTTGLFGCGLDSVSSTVAVYASPRPSFTISDSTGCAPLYAAITNTTPNSSNFQYAWDLGTGTFSVNSSSTQNIILPAARNIDTVYSIILKAYQYCDTVTITKNIAVHAKAKASLSAVMQNSCSPLNVVFSNLSAATGVQYKLSFGDGADSIITLNGNYSHTYHTGSPTTFNAILQATNGCGTDSSMIAFATTPNPVNTDLTLQDTVVCGGPYTMTLNNNTSSASGFTWDMGDGSAALRTATTGVIHYTYNQSGSYLITNTISSACSDSVVYRRLKIHPGVKAIAGNIVQGQCIGMPVDFKNLSDSSLAAQWSFGDGSIANTYNASHAFAQAGNYVATLKVSNAYNDITCADSTQQPVSLVASLPGSLALSDSVGKCLPFIVSVVNRNGGNARTSWTWGDGTTGSGDSISHTFAVNGRYTVNMQAKQAGGCMYVDSAVINVNAPAATLSYKGGAYCKQGNSIEFTPQTNATDSIRWDFGDGERVTTLSQKVAHSYNTVGGFLPKISLIGDHCVVPVTASDSIYIDEINAGFKVAAINNCAFTNYRFTDTSHSFFAITSRQWILNQKPQAVTGLTLTNEPEVQQVYTTAGDYEARLQVSNRIGCTARLDARFNVMIYEYPKADINAVAEACLHNMLEVKSIINSQDSVIRRLWNLGNGTAATDSIVKVQYFADGNYLVKLTVGTVNNCYDSAVKQLSVHPLPTLSIKNKIVCLGDSVELKATGAIGYIWSDQNNNIICSNCDVAKALPTKDAQYQVIGYNEFGCSNISTTTVRIIQPFKMSLLASDSMCEGTTKKLFVNGADSYRWAPIPGLSNYTSAITYASPATTTTYQVIGQDAYHCFADTATVKLVVGKPTPFNVGGDTTIPAGVPIQLNTGNLPPDIRQWQWGGKADYSCVYCASPQVKVNDDEFLTVKATNQFGCISTDTLYVKTFCSGSDVFIPNAFTPDGDGVNDILVPQGRGIRIVKSFRVFSRWGELVFEKTNFMPGDRSAGWDGRVRGKPPATDVYVYLCEAVCEKGTPYTFKGNVAIIK